jgi:hypothetical protein
MPKTIRTQLREAHEEIRRLKNYIQVDENPLRIRIAELERDLQAAHRECRTLVQELVTLRAFAQTIVARANDVLAAPSGMTGLATGKPHPTVHGMVNYP